MAPVVAMDTASAKNNNDRRFVTNVWMFCFMDYVSPSFPGWVLENFKLVAAGKPSGHFLDTRAWEGQVRRRAAARGGRGGPKNSASFPSSARRDLLIAT